MRNDGGLRVTAHAAAVLLLSALMWTACGARPTSPEDDAGTWRYLTANGVKLGYTTADSGEAPSLLAAAVRGRAMIEAFAGVSLGDVVLTHIHPSRATLEPDWQQTFGTPPGGFQCWMIANANRSTVMMLSPRVWASDSCGQPRGDSVAARSVLAHEMMHTLHRRTYPDSLFRGMNQSGWLYEGIAVYSSGQMAERYDSQVAGAVAAGEPATLASVLTTERGYAVAGSIVRYIDRKYGRAVLTDLMRRQGNPDILTRLGVTEAALLAEWRASGGQ
jgi:hypothetical protein